MESTPQQVIASALQLSPEDRVVVVTAIEQSLSGSEIDHGPREPADEVEAAWDAEIAKRIDDIDSGRVKTIPSKEAWEMIRGERPISF